MRTIKKVIPSNDDESISEHELIKPETAKNMFNFLFKKRMYGCLINNGWVLTDLKEYEFEVVKDNLGMQVLICKKVKS